MFYQELDRKSQRSIRPLWLMLTPFWVGSRSQLWLDKGPKSPWTGPRIRGHQWIWQASRNNSTQSELWYQGGCQTGASTVTVLVHPGRRQDPERNSCEEEKLDPVNNVGAAGEPWLCKRRSSTLTLSDINVGGVRFSQAASKLGLAPCIAKTQVMKKNSKTSNHVVKKRKTRKCKFEEIWL